MARSFIDDFIDMIGAARSNAAGFMELPRLNPITTKYMLNELPTDNWYTQLSHIDAKGKRLAMPLMGGYGDPWHYFGEDMLDERVTAVVRRKLELGDQALYPRAALLRDYPGYSIRIHSDSPRKVATLQIYLAADDSAPHLGVRFYRENGAEMVETGAVPYLPGSGYMFRRTPYSWHGVAETTEADGVRNSLMLIYFSDPRSDFT